MAKSREILKETAVPEDVVASPEGLEGESGRRVHVGNVRVVQVKDGFFHPIQLSHESAEL